MQIEALQILLILSGFLVLLFLAKKPSKHKRNIRNAKMILKKVRTFENGGSKLNYLRKIDPFVFEELLLEAFKEKGFKIIRNKRYTGDGGIDGKVIKDNKLYLVQAKRYSSAINPTHVEEFINVVIKQRAAGGYFVHTGRTGKTSYKKLPGNNIEIISGERLIKLIS